ncbi:hypothetical protein QMK19_40915, partial [Streptomyces sp. H10-C2]|uniref:hypothetical protein n=1 Tax=unclassified Streptomyces TaxID=2593676 RepID=UPI0024B9F56D
ISLERCLAGCGGWKRQNSHHPRSAGTSSDFSVHSPAATRWIEDEQVDAMGAVLVFAARIGAAARDDGGDVSAWPKPS